MMDNNGKIEGSIQSEVSKALNDSELGNVQGGLSALARHKILNGEIGVPIPLEFCPICYGNILMESTGKILGRNANYSTALLKCPKCGHTEKFNFQCKLSEH